eukprot:jgi/Botrbrau1/4073/Bobra.152_3s0028.1
MSYPSMPSASAHPLMAARYASSREGTQVRHQLGGRKPRKRRLSTRRENSEGKGKEKEEEQSLEGHWRLLTS